MIRYSLRHGVLAGEKNTRSEEARQISVSPAYPRSVYSLFIFFALYITLPVFDLPLLGLSLSAPIMFLVALPVFLRPPARWFKNYRLWIILSSVIWISIFLSATFNDFAHGGGKFDGNTISAMVQFAYWIIVFVTTAYLISFANLGARLSGALAIGIFALACLRLNEAIFGGGVGLIARLRWLSQNDYGLLFSTFSVFLLGFTLYGNRRTWAVLGTAVLWAVAALNGSRSSWIAMLVSTALFFWICLQTQRRRSPVILVILVVAVLLSFASVWAPDTVVSFFNDRFTSFQNLDADTSYAIRQLMIQKGIRLFRENPWTGVGIYRWTLESTALDIPRILQYAGQEWFDKKSAHNSYVGFLAETGLIGSIPLGILLVTLFVRGYRAASHLAAEGQLWAVSIYTGFIGMSIHLWSLAGLEGTAPWFIYGLVAAIIQMEYQSRKTASVSL